MVTSLILAPETAPAIETMDDVTYAAMSTPPPTATHEHIARRTRQRDTPPARAVRLTQTRNGRQPGPHAYLAPRTCLAITLALACLSLAHLCKACPLPCAPPPARHQPARKASTTPATHRHARPCTTGCPSSRRSSRRLSEQQRAATAAASSSNSSEQQQQQRTTAASRRSEQQRAAATPSSEQQQQGTAAAAAIRSSDRSSSSELYIPTHTSVRAYLPQRNLHE